ncbi:hypothetical protein [Microbacterium elymi]|uniref:Uncharacterized protein n=1 Tax=Microbacterium elymi TaxID=2909587 RepID=A0ABY5NIZ1_9MICO|nr:hypothetical protein [Microbacterium elymi]UUT35140.1 hypothetical protein L2X98_33370 [Microbacterium elymi]
MKIPADVAAGAERVRQAIAELVPAKSSSNRLIATWNLRVFAIASASSA